MKRYVFFLFKNLIGSLCLAFFLAGCAGCSQSISVQSAENAGTENQSLILCNWNLQTFFDPVKDGTEYKDFQKSEYWDKDAYVSRLKRLCEMMQSVNADVYCFEEMENQRIIQDIANQFASDNAWRKGKNWKYTCFSKVEGTAIGCAVLSCVPILSVKEHSLDIRTENEVQPAMRPILEVVLGATDEGNSGRTLTVFVNHWKSKASGENESEVWRDWQESLLASRLAEKDGAICTGDFNRDVWEFLPLVDDTEGSVIQACSPNLLLRHFSGNEIFYIPVYNPWIKNGRNAFETGSYLYNEQWERIDHIMAYGNVALEMFTPCTEGPWCDENKNPVPFKIYTGFGYSDHIPVCARVIF